MKLYQVNYTYLPIDSWDKISKTVYFASLKNAKYLAKELSKCFDVQGNVDIIDGLTGEVLCVYNGGTEKDIFED